MWKFLKKSFKMVCFITLKASAWCKQIIFKTKHGLIMHETDVNMYEPSAFFLHLKPVLYQGQQFLHSFVIAVTVRRAASTLAFSHNRNYFSTRNRTTATIRQATAGCGTSSQSLMSTPDSAFLTAPANSFSCIARPCSASPTSSSINYESPIAVSRPLRVASCKGCRAVAPRYRYGGGVTVIKIVFFLS